MSIAELVLYTAKNSRIPAQAEPVRAIGQSISTSKRFNYDVAFVELVQSTKPVPLKEVLEANRVAGLPFDRLWLEGCLPETTQQTKNKQGSLTGMGILVRMLPNSEGFEFQTILGIKSDPKLLDSMKRGPIKVIPHINGNYVLVDGRVSRMSFKHGFSFPDQPVPEIYTYMGNRDDSHFLKSQEITGDFLARTFAILGSSAVRHNIDLAHSAKEAQQDRQIRESNRTSARPRAPLTPILIDVSKDVVSAIKSAEPDRIRPLLGITSVRRSRPITSKHGIVFTRKPHDRKIMAPVDRRDAPRKVTNSSQDLALELGRRPILKKTSEPK